MICAYCKSDIDNDSFYCDQCSKELFVCSVCGKPGKGKNCVEDGSPLFSPKQRSSGAAPGIQSPVATPTGTPQSFPAFNQPVAQQPVFQPQTIQQPVIKKPTSRAAAPVPVLRLINNHLKIDIDITDGAVIGRSIGDYVSVFSQFSQVSGRHLQFIFDKNNGWSIKDLGSTNGVAISNQSNWQQVSRLNPNIETPIKDNAFLLIANIEFQMKIIYPPSLIQGTKRI